MSENSTVEILKEYRAKLSEIRKQEKKSGKKMPKEEADALGMMAAGYASMARGALSEERDRLQGNYKERVLTKPLIDKALQRERGFYKRAGYLAEQAYNLTDNLDKLNSAVHYYKQAAKGRWHDYELKPRIKELEGRLKREIKKGREAHDIIGRRITAVVSALFLLSSIFFLSPNFTGNVIGNMANSSSNILGAVLLVLGLVGGFFWMRSQKK